MTWKQVKEAIEAGGVTDDMEMWFIDIEFSNIVVVTPQTKDGPNALGFTVEN